MGRLDQVIQAKQMDHSGYLDKRLFKRIGKQSNPNYNHGGQ